MTNENVIKEVLEELKKDELDLDLIQDNKLIFQMGEDFYRVCMPSQKENAMAQSYKNKKRVELYQDGSFLTTNQLIKTLKEKQGVDIEDLNKKIKTMEEQLTQLYLSLSKIHDKEKKIIDKYIAKINKVRDERLKIVLEVADYLASSIQNQVQDSYYLYLTSLCTEILVDNNKDEWEKVWTSFDEFNNDRNKLSYIALGKLTELMYGV